MRRKGMIDESTLGPMTPVFTFVSFDGSNVTIHSGRLREEVLKRKPEVQLVPISDKIARSYITNNCVSPSRVAELAKRKNLDPIIFCEDGFTKGRPNVMLVDGHHRYVLAALAGIPHIPAILLLQAFWRPFQVIGMEKITADQLRGIPVHKRSY